MASNPTPVRRFTRRRMLSWGPGGLGAIAAGGVAGPELVLHDVLPGHDALNRLEGACNVPAPPRSSSPPARSDIRLQGSGKAGGLHDRLPARPCGQRAPPTG